MATPVGFPSDLEREESQLSLGSSEDYSTLDDIVLKKWKYAEISDLLQMQLAVMPGSQDNNGHSVIVIHAVEQQSFTVFNLGKILCYLKEITSDQVRKFGFTILVDVRQGTWSMIKKTLEVIKVTFVEYVHQVIIMKPKSMWQRGRSSVNFSFKKSKYDFKCILLEHSADVFHYISRSNVPTYQNGDFEYDHFKWISVIEKLEDLMTHLLSVKENYSDLQVIIAKDVVSVDLEEAKKAVKNHLLLLEKFDNHKLESLLTTVKNDVALLQSSTLTNPDFDAAFAQIFQLCDSLKTMNFYLNETWKKKGDSLDHVLQFKTFENDASQHQLWVYDQINYISCEITGIGTDVVSARASKLQIELYQRKINDKHAEINRVIEVGQRLISLNHPSSHLISNTIDEISTTWEKLMDSIHQRDSLMSLSASFHEKEERFIQHSESWMDECSSDSYKSSVQLAVTRHNELADTVSLMYTSAYQDGHHLIEKLRKPVGEGSVPFKFIQATRHVKERLENLYDERNMIEEQWKRRQKYLSQSLNFQLFQMQSEKVSGWIKESGYDHLLKNVAVGASVESVNILLKNHDCFESEAQMFYSQFNILKRKGKELCDNGECRSEEMEPEISTLEKIVHEFAVVLDERREVLLLAKQCFSATNNFLKEVQNVMSSFPHSKVCGTVSEVEGRIVYCHNQRDNINKIGCSTLALWSLLKEMVQSYVIQAKACNLSVKCDVALYDVENRMKLVDREKEKVDELCILREKRLECTVKRLNVFKEINEVQHSLSCLLRYAF
ncbi:PREDICTED: triple functional domain protein-like [Amphimedon queenslandica]|uniref:CRAL-TRIO domain-containing protein n=2 Tax=Amphimedon queenslandica TaxID=400682 RepID=A0AAN0JAX6_AMPQE|nr:PREDICTED: triple functional domain protein-like [Amphimedon queenslandica]|eukprot:XP_019853833.1 PREDICTED: triple functional domain protein-like [Amphimedon queenslandica]